MKDRNYLKSIYTDNNEIFMVDYNGTDTDIYKSTIKLNKDLSKATEENIYNEFIEKINSLNYDNIPLLYNKVYDINLENEKDIRTMKNLIKTGYEFLRGKSLLGDPNFLIINPKIKEKLKPYIKNLKLKIIEDSNLSYILIGIKNTWNQPGILLYYNGLKYSIEIVGYLPQNQYLKILFNLI